MTILLSVLALVSGSVSGKIGPGAMQRSHPIPSTRQSVDMGSVRSMDRRIAQLTSEQRQDRRSGRTKKADLEAQQLRTLKANRYFVAQRAYPNDRIDWKGFEKGRIQASRMSPTRFGGNRPGTLNWSFLGPTNMAVPSQQFFGVGPINGRVNAVAYDPNNSQTIFAGGAQGGLWKSTNSGSTWTWLSSTWTELPVNCIVVDPTDSNTIYVGRGDYQGQFANGYGIMKTTDGGVTWSEIAEATMGPIGVPSILMDPTNHNTLIAGTGDLDTYGGMYRSTDGGSTWKLLSVGGDDFMWPSIASSAPNAGAVRFYAVASGIAQATNAATRVYKSDDHGATWQVLASPIAPDGNFHWAYCVATSPTNSNNVYVLDSENQTLITSSSQGSTWTDVSANLPTGDSISPDYNFSESYYDYFLQCGNRVVGTANTDVLYLGEMDATESTDGGATWISFGGPSYDPNDAQVHISQHSMAVCPSNPNLAIFSNDGGVYSLSYNGTTNGNAVTSLNATLGNTLLYTVAPHPSVANYILAGARDNASPLSTGDLSNWLNVGIQDGGGGAINQTTPLIQYTTSDNFFVLQTPDGWKTINNISPTPGVTENIPTIAALSLDPANQLLMYTATNYLYQWNETTQTWSADLGGQDLSNQTGSGVVQAIAVAPTDSKRIYTGSDDGAVWMTTDQGSTWTQLSDGSGSLPNAVITSISVSPTNSSDILVGLSGTNQGYAHLFRCTNTQAATPTFTSVAGSGTTGLPDQSLNAIARDIDTPGSTWWVAMDVGIFESTDSGSTWTNAGSAFGLPNVIVNDLKAAPGTRTMYAATYGRGIWSLQLPNSQVTLQGFTISPTTVSAGDSSVGTVTLTSAAPSGGAVVNLTSGTTSVATVPVSVTVPAGATSQTFTISTNVSLAASGSAVIEVSYGGVTQTQTLNVVVPVLTGVTLSPTSVVGGNSTTGTVTISANAPSTGTTIKLASNNANAAVPLTVTVPGGSTTVTFKVNTSAVSATVTATITASQGTDAQTAPLTITPSSLSSVSISPTTVLGGLTATGTVTLTGAAGSNGNVVTLTASSTVTGIPTSVTVPAGANSVTFQITTTAVAAVTTSTITATEGTVQKTATLTVNPPTLIGFVILPSTVQGGTSATGTVTINGAAPSSGLVITLSSSNSSATVPGTVTIAPGATTATVKITTTTVTATATAIISATQGTTTFNANLTITASLLQSLSITPTSVVGGNSATGTVTLSQASPTGGTAISLSSGSSSASVPASVTVAAGATTATFTVVTSGVSASTTATITASSAGTSKTATLTIQPATLRSLTLSTNSIPGGNTGTGTVTLTGAAPTGGVTVALTSSSTNATIPSSVSVQGGSVSGTFTFGTVPVSASVSVTLTAKLGAVTQTAPLTILPATLGSVTVSPLSVVGGSGTAVLGTVNLNGQAAAAGAIVTLSSSNTKIATVPASVKLARGATLGTFPVTTLQVTSTQTVAIKATYGGVTQTATLTVTPFQIVSLTITPGNVAGGTGAVGLVTLNAPAGKALSIKLTSSSSSMTVPSTVSIVSGSTSGKITITTKAVSTTTSATLTATLGTSSQQASLTIQAPTLVSVSVTPSTVVGSSSTKVTGTVTISGPAPSTGLVITLSSSNTGAAKTPVSVTIASGKTTGTFTVTHSKLTAQASVTISAAQAGTTKTTTLTVTP